MTSAERTSARLEILRLDHPLGVVLSLVGDLDLVSGPVLQEQLDRVMGRKVAVVIDLTALRFIDSSGLHALVRAEEQLRASGGELVLVHGPRATRRVFELTNLDSYFAWSDSPSEALRTAAERRISAGAIPGPATDRQTADELDRRGEERCGHE